MHRKSFIQSKILVLIISFLFQSCAVWSYGIRPDKSWLAHKKERAQGTLTYMTKRTTIGFPLSSMDDLVEVFEENSPYTSITRAFDEKSVSKYVLVEEEYVFDSTIGLFWGYIAALTVFVLPAYYSGSGLNMRYHIIENQKTIKTYQYKISRKALAWLPMIFFSWANFITDSESDAIAATVRQFYEDAKKDNFVVSSL